jgi:hypothetical protein
MPMKPHFALSNLPLVLGASIALTTLGGCATISEPVGAPRKEIVYAVTDSNRLISFNAGQPQKLVTQKSLVGLQPNERILGIDFRVHRGLLYALGSTARLYTIDTTTGVAKPVGAPFAAKLDASEYGFDFNPVVDRIRVVGSDGQNFRLHPDSGAVVDADANAPGVQFDGTLAYTPGDVNAGEAPAITAAAYTYNKDNAKITTNYAIDTRRGVLAMQGSREGHSLVVSPNTGRLTTVGPHGVGKATRSAFDIADVTNAGFVAFTDTNGRASRFYLIDLETGRAKFLGTIGAGEPVRGLSVEP